MIKAVIFDLDGTIYKKPFLRERVMRHEIKSGSFRYLYLDRLTRIRLRGRSFDSKEAFYEHYFHRIDPHHPDEAYNWYFNHFLPLQTRLIAEHYHVADWVRPRLEQLRKAGMKLAVFSDYDFCREKLAALGLDASLFDVVVSAPELGGLKPSRGSAMRLVKMLGVKPSQCLIIGDRVECDGAMARKIGAHFELSK